MYDLAGLKETVQVKLGSDFQLVYVEVVYEDFVVQLNLDVTGGGLVPKEKAEEIRTVAREVFDKLVQVRMTIRHESGIKLKCHW